MYICITFMNICSFVNCFVSKIHNLNGAAALSSFTPEILHVLKNSMYLVWKKLPEKSYHSNII